MVTKTKICPSNSEIKPNPTQAEEIYIFELFHVAFTIIKKIARKNCIQILFFFLIITINYLIKNG